jgi:acetylornithine deacetylase/succinyl-diaminopimelate desuccinylase-like protein
MADLTFTPSELEAATSLLQDLLRLDTTNPPGNEAAAIELLAGQCRAAGLETVVDGAHPGRPNLVAKLPADPSRRTGRPLVLSGHVDCVPADPARWTHDPWSGHHDGTHVWGRGAIDMKGFVAMAFAVIARLARERLPLTRDVLFVVVSDEEAGTRLGSKWLVEERPDLLGHPEYVINEIGGFTVHREGRRFYPVQVAEKGVAWLRLSVSGRPGHSSLPSSDNAVSGLARGIAAITSARLPWHPSAEARRFLTAFAKPGGPIAERIAALLASPILGPSLLPLLVREPSRRASIEAILRNTATPTSLGSGGAINALPGVATVDLDGRLAPGQTSADLVIELERILRPVLGDRFLLTVLQESPSVSFSTDTPLYREIERTLREADPEGHPVPAIIPGFTDSRNWGRLGAACYGFYPLQLTPDLDFATLFHGDDERIPVAGFHWGIGVLGRMLGRFLIS